MQRGLRQGDPVSPFLLVMVAEALGRIVKRAECMGLIRGIEVAGDVNPISHLQFVDDTWIFCEANEDQVKNVKAILICYEAILGP